MAFVILTQQHATRSRGGCVVGGLPWRGLLVWWRKVNDSDVVDLMVWCRGAGRMVGSFAGG